MMLTIPFHVSTPDIMKMIVSPLCS